jgi:hypothetical protein
MISVNYCSVSLMIRVFLERTKKNFNYEAGVASSRPPYDSVGGTDYAKPKNYDAYGTSSSKPVGEVREKKHVTIAQPPTRERHRSQHHASHNHERGNGYEDDEP